jgi:hypothetical protein
MKEKNKKFGETIFIVKFMSTGKAEIKYMKVGRVYHSFAFVDTGGKIEDVIECRRKEIEKVMQEQNDDIKIHTKVCSKHRFKVLQILLTKSISDENDGQEQV